MTPSRIRWVSRLLDPSTRGLPALVTRSELNLAFRSMRRQPILTTTAVVALATGIGLATMGFTLLEAVVYSRLPFAGGDRFVLLDAREEPELAPRGLERGRFTLLEERTTALDHLGAVDGRHFTMRLPSGAVITVSGAAMTAASFGVFPYGPVGGRIPAPADEGRGAPRVVVIRESLARRHFSDAPRAIGAVVTIAGVPRTIVGVMPDDFEFPNSGEIWIPFDGGGDASADDWQGARVFGVAREGVPASTAQAELQTLSRQFESSRPEAPRLRIGVLPFTEALSRGLDLLSAALVAVLVLVLVVISANLANLVLARTAARSTELAIRTALGASRGRLVGQLFTEVLLLGAPAAAIGVLASQAALGAAERRMTDMPFWVDFSAGWRTVAFVVWITLLATAICGAMPALRVTRRNTAEALARGSRGASFGFGRVAASMVAVQIALSIALLNAALVMARGVSGYAGRQLGLPDQEVLTARVSIENTGAAGGAAIDAVPKAIARLPGVVAAGVASSLPRLSPPTVPTEVQPEGNERPRPAQSAPLVSAGPGFFETLDAQPIAGRLFTEADVAAGAPPVAIVNEPFVRTFLGGGNAIGRRLRTFDEDGSVADPGWREIVGVVPDLGLSAGDEAMAAGWYVPLSGESNAHLALRVAGGDATGLTPSLRRTIGDLDARIQVWDVRPLGDVGSEDRAVFAGIGAALVLLGGMALVLSIVGAYALLSFSVTQRTREIGIRAALGASRGRILRTVVGSAALPLAIGAIAGALLAPVLVEARVIFAFRLPGDSGPWGLPVLVATFALAGLVACWLPGRRALGVPPGEALRAE
jgi:predicted permease